jgi:hypothetical protein
LLLAADVTAVADGVFASASFSFCACAFVSVPTSSLDSLWSKKVATDRIATGTLLALSLSCRLVVVCSLSASFLLLFLDSIEIHDQGKLGRRARAHESFLQIVWHEAASLTKMHVESRKASASEARQAPMM